MISPNIKILESPEELKAIEELQREVWSGSETDVVPAHVFIAAVHNGGIVLGHISMKCLLDLSLDSQDWKLRRTDRARNIVPT